MDNTSTDGIIALATILYARVSTADQTIAHQRTQAEAAGFVINNVVEDHGVSGVNTKLAERPGGSRLFDILRAGDTLVVRWVDRLGRNYEDGVETIRTFMQRGVTIRTVIGSMTFDGSITDPMQKAIRDALIGFMSASAQAQAEATKAAQKAGIAHAKGIKAKAYRGRKPSFTRPQLAEVQALLGQGAGISEIAGLTSLSRQTVYRIEADPAAHEAMLAAWEA